MHGHSQLEPPSGRLARAVAHIDQHDLLAAGAFMRPQSVIVG